MVVVRIRGGLGNQLFQYSFGYAVAKRQSEKLMLDLSDMKGKSGIFIKGINLFKQAEYEVFESNLITRFLQNKYVGALLRNIPHFFIYIGRGYYYYKEPKHKYISNLPTKGNVYYDGYWQSSKYFKDYEEDIRKLILSYDVSEEAKAKLFPTLDNCNSVGVHIRKGDFGSGRFKKVGHLLPIDYYLRAIEYCEKKLNNPVFFFFSDDPEWVKEQLGNKSHYRFVSDICNTGLVEDLIGISKCHHGIMSASTFSWWGNWLRNSNGVVVRPKGHYYNEYFFESNWISM